MCLASNITIDSGDWGTQTSNEFNATTQAGLLHRSQSSPIMGYRQEVSSTLPSASVIYRISHSGQFI